MTDVAITAEASAAFPHLRPEVAAMMACSIAERIALSQSDQWIRYTRADEILTQLEDLMTYPRSIRMPNVLVVAQTDNGKSSLLRQFVDRHPPEINLNGEATMRLVSLAMPETVTEGELWSSFLWALAISHRERDPPALKKRQVKTVLANLGTKVVVFDEFNNLIRTGKAGGNLLAAIKGLSNDLRLSIAAFGTPEASFALNTDPHMKTRFQAVKLDPWILPERGRGAFTDLEKMAIVEYRRFLMSYERRLPLARPSNLHQEPLMTEIYKRAGKAIGGTVKILKTAAAKAISTGDERITVELLKSLPPSAADSWAAVENLL